MLASVATPGRAEAQLKKRLMQTALCGGMAYGGWKLGEKVAQYEIKRQGLTGTQATQMTKALQVGAALVFCQGGAALAGTAYDKLSKRDLEARQKEMDAALAEGRADHAHLRHAGKPAVGNDDDDGSPHRRARRNAGWSWTNWPTSARGSRASPSSAASRRTESTSWK